MQVTIFTYNREEMLHNLLKECLSHDNELLIIDDRSGYDYERLGKLNRTDWVIFESLEHTGKKGFWKKWDYAINECKFSSNNWFLFLPDDVTNVDFKAIENLTKQGWDDKYLAINLSHSGHRYRWGKWDTGQQDIEVEGMLLQECGYVDGCFLTNRKTLEQITIDPVPSTWFDRPDKSSGVGYQMSMKLRKLGCVMMLPEFSYLYHGDHESVMHKEHRKAVPLISKMKG